MSGMSGFIARAGSLVKPGSQLVTLAQRLSAPLLAVSLAGWVLLLVFDSQPSLASLCLSAGSQTIAGGLNAAFEPRPFQIIALSWLFMVVAMMSPLLTQPMAQLRLRSFRRRRGRAVALFITGYLSVWMMAGLALLPAMALLGRLADTIALPAWVVAISLAAIWQTTPLRQRALNRCHRLPHLSAFGAAADRDCVSFGLGHGFWCIATCAPWMLLTLATPSHHLPVMLAISIGILLERMLPARRPAWTLAVLPGQTVIAMLFRRARGTPHDYRNAGLSGSRSA